MALQFAAVQPIALAVLGVRPLSGRFPRFAGGIAVAGLRYGVAMVGFLPSMALQLGQAGKSLRCVGIR